MLWVHTCCNDKCLLTNSLRIWDIYYEIFRLALAKYCVWTLCFNYICLGTYRKLLLLSNKTPWKQTTSANNDVIERFWPKVNSVVNCPKKDVYQKQLMNMNMI